MSFDEVFQEMLTAEFSTRAAVEDAPAGTEGPGGFARYRTAALVGAGGLACAAAGAFLGGLGGYFAVHPVVAHSLSSSTSPGQKLAGASNEADNAAWWAVGSAVG